MRLLLTSVTTLRPATILTSYHRCLTAPLIATQRSYATTGTSGAGPGSSSDPKAAARKSRRAVTPFNDDGHVPWADLSVAEKTARATQQSLNFGFIIVGVVLTGGVGYLLWTEVFSPESKTMYFNRAVDRIKKDQRCLALLGDSHKIIAHGAETHNRWKRSRPLASSEKTDPQGNQHLIMQFFVEGPLNEGTVNIHLIKYRGHSDFEYKHFYVDIKGQQRIYLEKDDANSQQGIGKGMTKLFGIKWS